VDVVLSCYRLYGAKFTQLVLAARVQWEEAARARRQQKWTSAVGGWRTSPCRPR